GQCLGAVGRVLVDATASVAMTWKGWGPLGQFLARRRRRRLAEHLRTLEHKGNSPRQRLCYAAALRRAFCVQPWKNSHERVDHERVVNGLAVPGGIGRS